MCNMFKKGDQYIIETSVKFKSLQTFFFALNQKDEYVHGSSRRVILREPFKVTTKCLNNITCLKKNYTMF